MRFCKLSVLLACGLFLGGCGYRIGSLMHPQVQSIAVAPVTNDTAAFNVSAVMRSLLCERFMVDGSLKLKDMTKADCIVYVRVLSIDFSEVAWTTSTEREDRYNTQFTPNRWQVNLTAEYSVIMPGRAEPLIPKGKISGFAEFETGPDMQIGRDNGIRQAAYMAAKNLVAAVTEGW